MIGTLKKKNRKINSTQNFLLIELDKLIFSECFSLDKVCHSHYKLLSKQNLLGTLDGRDILSITVTLADHGRL